MKISTAEIIGGVGLVAVVSGALWLGALENRVDQLEKRAQELSMGPRGENCQLIVERLVQKPTDKALKDLADEWGCSNFTASDRRVWNPPSPPPPEPEK